MFYQREWQSIPLQSLSEGNDTVAGRGFYDAYYRAYLSGQGHVSDAWREQKHRLAAWLAARTTPAGRVLSIGAGLGVMEQMLVRAGCRVDVIEFEEPTLHNLRRVEPRIGACVADARALPFAAGTYDLAYLCNVDYCFDRDAYAAVLAGARSVVRPDGALIVISSSNLSLSAWARGLARTAVGSAVPRGVAWGYLRSPDEHLRAGRAAGLRCDGVHLFDNEYREIASRPGEAMHAGWWTLRSRPLGVVFRKPA